jgi:hypothetical protein
VGDGDSIQCIAANAAAAAKAADADTGADADADAGADRIEHARSQLRLLGCLIGG